MDGSYKLFAAGEEEGDENDSEKSMEEVDLQKYSLFDVAYDSIDLCPSPHYAGVAIKRSAKEEEVRNSKGSECDDAPIPDI
ncbi:hypothetical protein TL16_g11014 [Triparma laevis f. inornata]|uniref:Uncharacterized protein n=1 Tax=Triparma laevis f. inornata TaxID=1714386 RepID=A0A9W7ERC2_9STRA|nr:hypothetical protein TL16_g11014 [Triparma laevis f. inornata]